MNDNHQRESYLLSLILRLRTVDPAIARGLSSRSFTNPNAAAAFTYLCAAQERSSTRETPTLVMFRTKFPGIPTTLPQELDGIGVQDLESEIVDTVAAVLRAKARVDLQSTLREGLQALEGGADPSALMDSLERRIGAARPDRSTSTVTLIGEMGRMREDYEMRLLRGGVMGIETPFPSLTNVSGGWQRGKFYVFAAATGVGKSWLMFKLAQDAWARGHRVLLALGEMLREDAARRIASLHLGISYHRYKKGRLREEEHERMLRGIADVARWEEENNPLPGGRRAFFIRDANSSPTGGPSTVEQVASEAARLGCDLVLYDSAYKAVPGFDAKDVNSLSSSLLRAAGKTNIPWIVSVQLNDQGATWAGRGWEKDAEMVTHLCACPHPESGEANPFMRLIGFENTKNRDGAEDCAEFGCSFDPGLFAEWPHPVSCEAIRRTAQSREATRGRRLPDGKGGAEATRPVVTQKPGSGPGQVKH